jgi:hypothetical protein
MRGDAQRRFVSWRWALGAGIAWAAVSAILMTALDRPATLGLDNATSIFPLTLEAFRSWTAGRLPEWTDLFWGGAPLIGHGLGGALYLPHGVAFLRTPSPHLRAFDLAAAMHTGWMVGGTVVLLGELGVASWVALAGASLTALSAFVAWTAIAWLPGFVSLAWWPWLMVAAERLARRPTGIGGPLLLGWVALAAQVHAGFPEHAFYGGIIAAGWVMTASGPVTRWRQLTRVVLLGLGALALAAPTLWPLWAQAQASSRAVGTPDVGMIAYALSALPSLVIPWPRAHGDLPVFIGLITLVVGLVGSTRHPFLACAALVSAVLALGVQTPIYDVVHGLPGFDRFRTPFKFCAIVEIATAWLAAIGLERVRTVRARWAPAVAIILALVAVGERATRVTTLVPTYRDMSAGPLSVPSVRERLRGAPVHGDADRPPPLVMDTTPRLPGQTRRTMLASIAAIDGVATVYGGDLPLLDPQHTALRRRRRLQPRALDRLGIRFLLDAPDGCGKRAEALGLRVHARTTSICVLENATAQPRYTLETDLAVVTSDAELLGITRFGRRQPVPVLAPPDALADIHPSPRAGRVVVDRYRPGLIEVRTAATTPTFLLVRHSRAPGWSASVDGRPEPVWPALGTYFGLRVPAGEHLVQVRHAEPGVRAGLVIAAGWLLCWSIGLLVQRRRPSAR